ncbi:MAG: hypothetical protein KatS3mg029_0007 [Saprospiraceae bacterium]|nr:MAG: hypothetical protein KatS3mg029_0007 [Saprospiraceae bacterium]
MCTHPTISLYPLLMKGFFTFFLLIFSFPVILTAQKHDYNWLFGYQPINGPHPVIGNSKIDFNDFPPAISKVTNGTISFDLTNASISDSTGNLLFYTNGIVVVNAQHQVMENGDSLNPGEVAWDWYNEGYIVQQGALILPVPSSANKYYLFHSLRERQNDQIPYPYSPYLYMTLIDMNENNGLGTVVFKNNILLTDTLALGKLVATKHANGRDWWILVPERDRYSYHRLLLTPDSIYHYGIQPVYPSEGFGQGAAGFAAFSPDGSKYARHDLRGSPLLHFVRLYDFDRCTGLLSNQLHIPLSDTAGVGGIAFSPDSRYMYVSSDQLVYQFDVTAPDVEATKTIVAVSDGFRDTLPDGSLWFPMTFSGAMLGPDGRIYIHSAGSSRHLHVIEYPNRGGTACEVRQHAIKLPAWTYRTIPNVPHYRLGPLDGSPCDTLGLNNHPLAGFRHAIDSSNSLRVIFTDNSFYAPTDWLWDFGDGSTSSLKDPLHKYASPGTYLVCLTVSNQYDSDTFCREVTVDAPNATEESQPQAPAVKVWPNPARSGVVVELPQPSPRPVRLVLYDALGREVYRMLSRAGDRQLFFDVSGWAGGVYAWQLWQEGRMVGTGKVVVVE